MDGMIPPPPDGYTIQPDMMAAQSPSGLIAPGNIDLSKRPIAHNSDGSYSTVRSISVDQDGVSYLIPTVVNGVVVPNDQAIQHFQKTGENLGKFKTWQDADKYAETLHNEQAKAYDAQAGQPSIPPPPPGYQMQGGNASTNHADFSEVEGGALPDKPRSFGQDLGRAAIMTGRNVVQGVTGIPALLHDALVMTPYNAIASAVGSDSRINPGGQQIDSYMNAMGIPNPQPENATERVVSGIDRGLGGLASGVGAGALLKAAATPAGAITGAGSPATYGAAGVGDALTSNLGAQTAATGIGTGASEVARESGHGPGAQMAAGLLGGGLPAVLGGGKQLLLSGAGRLLGKPSPQAAELANQAIDAGIPLKASQVSPSKFVKLVDSVTGQVPFSGAQGFQNTQQQAFNRAVGRTIGADSDAITADVFARAKNKASNGFNTMWRQNSLTLTPDVLKRVVSVVNDAAALGGQDVGGAMGAILDRLAKQGASGVLPGRAFQSIDSQLGQMAAMGGEKAHYAGQMQEALRDAMQSGLPKDAAAKLSQLRETWKNLKTIEPLVAKDGVEGNISPAQLMGRVASNGSGKAAMASGRRGDLGDLANIGQRFLKSQIPDSGTAQRVFAGKALGSAGSIGGGLAAGSLLGPLGGLAAVGGAVGSSRLAQALMKNPALVGSLIGRKSPSEINRLLMLSADPAAQSIAQPSR